MNLKTVISGCCRVLAIVLTLAVLLPSAIKLNHLFTHHEHKVCDNDTSNSTHFHETDLDCDFCKFKLSETHYLELNPQTTITKENISKTELSYYLLLRTHTENTSYLRGPPALV